MKGILYGAITVIVGYIISGMFAGVGTSSAEISYISMVSNSVIFLSGVITFWGYMLYKK